MTKAKQKGLWLQQFMLVLVGQGFSLLGSGLVQFAIIWWLTRETGSAIVLTAAAIFGLLPMILISPFAGAIADRVNRKTILMVADGFVALISLLMAVLFHYGMLQLWLVYLFMMLRSAGNAFHQPAFEAAMPQIAPVRHLVRVNSALQFIRSGVNLAAPLLGAILIENFSLPLILLVDVITAAIAIALLLPVQILDVRQPEEQPPTLRVYLQDMREGLRYIRQWRGLSILILIFAFTNFLFSPLVTLMALIVSKHFNGGALEYSYVEMMLAAGILLGSLAITAWGGFRRRILNINFGQVISGVALTVAGFLRPDALVPFMFCMLVCGISSCFINAPAMAIVQSQVDPDMLGRVMSIVSALCMLAMPVSLILAGPLVELIGLMPLIYIPGIISGLLGVACFFIPDLMNIETKSKTAVKTTVPEM
ncbi:MAG: MFS transporter [Ruminococcaceae bacterium]|nr:MFS transporter [Oscillospiraceae bacterium]